jgi:hypothetical protein
MVARSRPHAEWSQAHDDAREFEHHPNPRKSRAWFVALPYLGQGHAKIMAKITTPENVVGAQPINSEGEMLDHAFERYFGRRDSLPLRRPGQLRRRLAG